MMQAIRSMSAHAVWIGQLRIERSFVSVIPTAQVQPMALRIIPVCKECCTQSSDQLPVLREHFTVLVDHLVRFEFRDSKASSPAS